jgi:hypothetical protein
MGIVGSLQRLAWRGRQFRLLIQTEHQDLCLQESGLHIQSLLKGAKCLLSIRTA